MINRLRSFALSGWLLAALLVPAARAQVAPGKTDPDGLTFQSIKAAMPEYFKSYGNGRAQPADIPDVFGPGAVLTVGNIFMKVTNWGHVGNLFTNVSSDPSAQWPGASGVEYLSSIRLAVGAVNPTATDPTAIRRVSYLLEWRPPTLLPEDRIYRAYDGIINGNRFVNDDNDKDFDGKDIIDEDFLDGHDNDGDGKIDEDYGAVGQMMYSCVMRDDTQEALAATFNEKHVPLGLECQQVAWAYSIPGFTDFNVVQYTIKNVSGHELDSLYIGWLVDMDCGPLATANFFSDDLDIPGYPQGDFVIPLDATDARQQKNHAKVEPQYDGKPLCQALNIHINGFSIADDDGDLGRTKGVPSFLLINFTTDPTGRNAPAAVRFRSFRSFTAGTPYAQGGNPTIDQERYEFMSSGDNIDHTIVDDTRHIESRMITLPPGDQKGDFVQWCSVGPWIVVPNGGSVQATIALSVRLGGIKLAYGYAADYQRFTAGLMSMDDLRQKYPSLDNAITAQMAYEGVWEPRSTFTNTNFHGRESAVTVPRGAPPYFDQDCRDAESENFRQVNELGLTWFDYDCDYCTGVYDADQHLGLFHHTWSAASPPPNPNTNLSVNYNYTANETRTNTHTVPMGDREITLAWDNLSEVTPDPKTNWFDCRGYKIWKVANWLRPVGSPGPAEDDWSLIGEYRLFHYRDIDRNLIANNLVDSSGIAICPKLYIPNYKDPVTGAFGPAVVPICLQEGDLWDRQSGNVIHPDPSLTCVSAGDTCTTSKGCVLGSSPCLPEIPTKYPVGRYRFVDPEVKNGFTYFYSVTAFDSTGDPAAGTKAELEGRRSAVEAEGVSPQVATRTGKNVWVVPNPYRGYSTIAQRPSTWDLIPNATDPTGTHIDFFGMPPGQWTIKIFTISGDLVQTLHSYDPVNESLRGTVTGDNGTVHSGANLQQDNPNDGQARWNLISRNGQDVVSGIYIYTVDSSQGTQRGHFVIIR